jgi:hypothetical protein
VFRLAEVFNANHKDHYSEAEEHEQIKRLDAIMETAGAWLTSKPLKQEGGSVSQAKAQKNSNRWIALSQICEQCGNELIAMGYRPLYGAWAADPLHPPSGAHANYWLERLDPKHRSATALKGCYETWSKLPQSSPHYGKTFFEYVDATRADLQQSVRYDKNKIDTDAAARRLRRRELQALLEGGKVYRVLPSGNRGDIYDTVASNMKTEFAGTGFAIFVWDHKKRLFSGLHVANSLHHSTPRGGKPVKCAGELRTNNEGKLVMITSKTGHYTTTPKEFREFVEYLRTNNALTDQTICVPDTSGQAQGSWHAFRAKQWLTGGTRISRADVVSAVPGLDTDLKSRNFYLRLAA